MVAAGEPGRHRMVPEAHPVSLRTARIERSLGLLILLGCLLVTAVVYGQATHFAFTFDDPLDLPRAEGRSVWSLFSSSAGYAYYRPIPFIIWKFARALQGHYDEATLHGITLLCHILTAWLLALLVRRLTGDYWGVLAALLLLIYPFSYQAVLGAHTLFHPLMTAALLLALFLYWGAQQALADGERSAVGWAGYGGAVLAAAVGLWTHESGVVILPLMAGLELLRSRQHGQSNWRWSVRSLAPFAGLTILFLLVWRLVPKFDRPEPWSADSLLPNARYLLQGVIWPIAAQLNRWGAMLGVAPLKLLWPAIGLTLLVVLVLYVVGRHILVPLVALGAVAIILFPAWLMLSWTYLEDAPRLLYPAVPAIAVFWGLLPSLRWRWRWATWSWRGLSLLFLLAVTVQSLHFIALRRDMWAEGTKLIHAVADRGAAQGDRPLLFLNVPAWFAPKDPEYPVGHVGLTALPGYVGLGRSVYIHRGVQPPLESAAYYPDLNGWKYDFNTHGAGATLAEFAALLRRVDGVVLVTMTPTGARLVDTGALRPGRADRATPGPVFGQAVKLRSVHSELDNGQLVVDLTWDVVAPVSGDLIPVLILRNGTGQLVREWRNAPLAGIGVPQLWQVDDQIQDRVYLPLPARLSSGPYRLYIQWEERTSRAVVPGLGADGQPLPAEGLFASELQQP